MSATYTAEDWSDGDYVAMFDNGNNELLVAVDLPQVRINVSNASDPSSVFYLSPEHARILAARLLKAARWADGDRS